MRHVVVGESQCDGVGAGERRPGEGGVQTQRGRVPATAGNAPPTSGMKPMPTSGIAIFEVSVTTRVLACALTPTPPPITMPSINDTYGLGNRPIWPFEQVLVAPEPARFDPVRAGAVVDRDHVAAGAQSALAGPDSTTARTASSCSHRVSTAPSASTMRLVQRVDRLGAVERHKADAFLDAGQNFVGFLGHAPVVSLGEWSEESSSNAGRGLTSNLDRYPGGGTRG